MERGTASEIPPLWTSPAEVRRSWFTYPQWGNVHLVVFGDVFPTAGTSPWVDLVVFDDVFPHCGNITQGDCKL